MFAVIPESVAELVLGLAAIGLEYAVDNAHCTVYDCAPGVADHERARDDCVVVVTAKPDGMTGVVVVVVTGLVHVLVPYALVALIRQ